MFFLDVDNIKGAWEPVHVDDPTHYANELFLFARKHEPFLLCQVLGGAIALHFVDSCQALNRLANRRKVRKHAAKPAVADEIHPRAKRFVLYSIARLLLGSDKENALSLGGNPFGCVARFIDKLLSLFKIDDVNPIALHKYILAHLRIPSAGEVAKVSTCCQELFNLYIRHNRYRFV